MMNVRRKGVWILGYLPILIFVTMLNLFWKMVLLKKSGSY